MTERESQLIDFTSNLSNGLLIFIVVKVLADVAHMFVQNESMESLLDYKGWVVHAHTSNPDPDPSFGKKRIYPEIGDKFSQASLVNALKEIGVEHCSIEADVIDFEADAKKAYEVLKELK